MTDAQTATRLPVALDKVQIAALKGADRIVFRNTPERRSQIEAIKERKPTEADPFACDQTVYVSCMCAADDFGHKGTDEYPSQEREFSFDELNAGAFCGFEMFHTPQSNKVWRTIVGSLRGGDVLGLRWMRNGGTSPAIFACGVVVDSLHLWVERGDKCIGTHVVSTHAVPVSRAEHHRLVRRYAY